MGLQFSAPRLAQVRIPLSWEGSAGVGISSPGGPITRKNTYQSPRIDDLRTPGTLGAGPSKAAERGSQGVMGPFKPSGKVHSSQGGAAPGLAQSHPGREIRSGWTDRDPAESGRLNAGRNSAHAEQLGGWRIPTWPERSEPTGEIRIPLGTEFSDRTPFQPERTMTAWADSDGLGEFRKYCNPTIPLGAESYPAASGSAVPPRVRAAFFSCRATTQRQWIVSEPGPWGSPGKRRRFPSPETNGTPQSWTCPSIRA